MPWSAPKPAPMCPACSGSVFPAEAYMASDRRPFHKQCVKCSSCRKNLSPSTINEHMSKLFCNLCYTNMFMPQEDQIPERMVMQVLPVGGIYTAIEEEKRRILEEGRRREEAELAKKRGGCPSCYNMVNADDSAEVSGVKYHKACLKCNLCARAASEDMPMMLGPKENDNAFGEEELEPFCKFCFAKKFNMSALNIAETVNIIQGMGTVGL